MPVAGMIQKNPFSPDVDEILLVLLPQVTTAERDNLTLRNGLMLYNTTTASVQVYQGGVCANV